MDVDVFEKRMRRPPSRHQSDVVLPRRSAADRILRWENRRREWTRASSDQLDSPEWICGFTEHFTRTSRLGRSNDALAPTECCSTLRWFARRWEGRRINWQRVGSGKKSNWKIRYCIDGSVIKNLTFESVQSRSMTIAIDLYWGRKGGVPQMFRREGKCSPNIWKNVAHLESNEFGKVCELCL